MIINLNDLNCDGYSTRAKDIIDKIIIGPSDNPQQLKEIFIDVLLKKGVVDAEKRVVISDIPLRV